MQPAPPNPVQQNGRQGRSHLGHQVSLFTGTSVQTEVVCRFCGVQGPRKLMIAPCACSTDETRYIHRSCLNTQRWTDPNPAAFKKCLVCDLDYHMQLRPGAGPDKSMTARFFRYVRSSFPFYFFIFYSSWYWFETLFLKLTFGQPSISLLSNDRLPFIFLFLFLFHKRYVCADAFALIFFLGK